MNDAIISDIHEKNNFPGRDALIKLVKKDNPTTINLRYNWCTNNRSKTTRVT